MTECLVPRSGNAPLKFEGELISKAGDDRFGGKEQNRWHELLLYRTTGGKWIVAIRFRTRWQGEPSYDYAHVCDSADCVRDRLREYDPVPPRVGFPSGSQYIERQKSLIESLRAQYDAAVSELLSRDEFAVSPEQEQSEQYAALDLQCVSAFVGAQLADFPLSRGEACALCDANNGAMLWPEECWLGLAANIEDTPAAALSAKWDCDAQALAKRIWQADRGTQFALAWACAQFWRRSEKDADVALREAGLFIK